MKRVALLAQNRQEAESARLLAAELRRQGWAEPRFWSLDAFLAQGAEAVVEGVVEIDRLLPRHPLESPFYRLGGRARLRVVVENRGVLARIADTADALVVGCDGALERIAINAMRRQSKGAYLVVNGLHFHRRRGVLRRAIRSLLARRRLNHLFYSEVGQGECRRIFALGEHSRGELLRFGIDDRRIEVTGAPRFAPLLAGGRPPAERIAERLGAAAPVRLLYLLGAWDWHGHRKLADLEFEQVAACARICRRLPAPVDLAVRAHPRSSARELGRMEEALDLRPAPPERPLEQALEGVDGVMATASTGFLEALAAGRLVLAVDLFGIDRALATQVFERRGVWTVRTATALAGALTALATDPAALAPKIAAEAEALWHFLSPRTPEAARRIAERIRRDLEPQAARSGR